MLELLLYLLVFFFLLGKANAESLALHGILTCDNSNNDILEGQSLARITNVVIPNITCDELKYNQTNQIITIEKTVQITFHIETGITDSRKKYCSAHTDENYFFVNFENELKKNGDCSQMVELDLTTSQFYISSIGSDVLMNMPELGILSIPDHRLDSLDFLKNVPLPRLSILDVHTNGITSLDEVSFSNFPSLSFLDLSYNRIQNLPEDGLILPNIPKFDFLSLQGNDIQILRKDAISMVDGPVKTLKFDTLRFNNNPIKKLEPGSLSKISKGVIDLQSTPITSIEVDTFYTGPDEELTILLYHNLIDCCSLNGLEQFYEKDRPPFFDFHCYLGGVRTTVNSYTTSFDFDCCGDSFYYNYETFQCESCLNEDGCATISDSCTKDLVYGKFQCLSCPSDCLLVPFQGEKVSTSDQGSCMLCGAQDGCSIHNHDSCLQPNASLLANFSIEIPTLPCDSCKESFYLLNGVFCEPCTVPMSGCEVVNEEKCVINSTILYCDQCSSGFELNPQGICTLLNNSDPTLKLAVSISVSIFVIGVALTCGVIYYIYHKKKMQSEKFGGLTPEEFINIGGKSVTLHTDEQYQEIRMDTFANSIMANLNDGGKRPLSTVQSHYEFDEEGASESLLYTEPRPSVVVEYAIARESIPNVHSI